MLQYKEYQQLNLTEIAQKMHSYWEKNNTFEQSVQGREKQPNFIFYEGPPSANGSPGTHHLLAITLKDLFNRYKTLQGYQVKRKSGWDTHGLPVELQVEKKLGITKEDIGKKISIADYNAECKKTVMQYKDQWEQMNQAIGYWKDNQNPYITFDRNYIETVWYLLKELYKKRYLYKGYAIQPYSPAAGTGLSSHELSQPGCYQDVKDTTVVAQFKIVDTQQDYFLAWTTTPWTLPANSALAVGGKITYVKVATFNPYTHLPIQVILAQEALPRYFQGNPGKLSTYQPGDTQIPWEVVVTYKGVDLIGKKYEQLLPYVQPNRAAFQIIQGDFVTTTEGTGIVHIAPTFGSDDQQVAQKENIPPITVKDKEGNEVPIVDKQGRFVAEISDFAGYYVKSVYDPHATEDTLSVDILIATQLKKSNKAFKVEKYTHSYPHCWRTDKPILYYPLDTWFIKTTACKERLIELNKTINWQPDSVGKGRFGNWLANLVDWNLSRDRYWGIPIPIWRTVDQQEEKCIGSMEELHQEVAHSIAAGFMTTPLGTNFDPHRPYVDDIILVSQSGKKMYRESALIDVWFDSGAMPYAQWHYPFENKEIFNANYPADLIAEGVDQTRGWFFTLHAISVLLFDQPAFKNVIVNGLVLDRRGAKMSKRLGNAVDAMAIIKEHGPDAIRWYMVSNGKPWENLKFDIAHVVEVTRKFFATLHSTYSFFALYANLDQFQFKTPTLPIEQRPESDRWILSRCNSVIEETTAAYDVYDATYAARIMQKFVVDDLSNWYVRLNRKRFWKNKQDQDKESAYQTLYTCLITVARLAAPIAPFYMDQLFQDLNNVTKQEEAKSVHLEDFPIANRGMIDNLLETRMGQGQVIVALIHALRKKHKIKVRQPLSRVFIPTSLQLTSATLNTLAELIKTEVNVKEVQGITEMDSVITKSIKPNFKVLGKKHGSLMKEISQAMQQLNQADIQLLEEGGTLSLSMSTITLPITLADVMITSQDIPGWLVASEGEITVALDTTLTETLKQEGLARDVVNRIQHLRKDMGLAVQDKIRLTIVKDNPYVVAALQAYQDYICGEVQAFTLHWVATLRNGAFFIIDSYKLNVEIEKV